jgi:hypothetical protein
MRRRTETSAERHGFLLRPRGLRHRRSRRRVTAATGTKPNQYRGVKPNQTRPRPPKPDQPDRTKPAYTKPDQTEPNRTRPNLT